MPSINNLPGYAATAEQKVPELLAFTNWYWQTAGVLKSGVGAVVVGQAIAIDAPTSKYVKYAVSGISGANVCRGFVRIPGDSTSKDVGIEVVIGGAVKYSLVSGISGYNAGILTDLGARIDPIADALMF